MGDTMKENRKTLTWIACVAPLTPFDVAFVPRGRPGITVNFVLFFA